MSKGEVLVSGGEASESGDEILKRLPPWMPRTESSGNFKLIDVVGRGFDRLGDDISDIDDATNVQTAQSVDQLKELSEIVDVRPKSGEGIEKYRRRIIAAFQNTTNEGDLPSLFENISVLLEIDKADIEYLKGQENGAFLLSVPSYAIDNASLTNSEFGNIINDQVAAGFRPDIQTRGSFSYMTPTEYNDGTHDSTKGYDGLDTNGDPKDNGGTYAGVLN
jgi:hypothetical protein